MDWGWAESHPARSKINEIEDVASKMHDYIRKVVDPVWLFNFKKPKDPGEMQFTKNAATFDRPSPIREDMPALYVPNPNAKAQPLVTDMIDIEHTSQALSAIIQELERDFPELQMDIWSVGGYTTGTAMKTARQRVERKVQQRRPNYDKALIKAHKMALCIGGMRNIEGYEFGIDDYGEDTLDHYIPSDRVIFEVDALEELDKKKKFWDALVNVLSKAPGQIPPEAVLKDFGWSEERIKEYVKLAEEYKTQHMAEMAERSEANGEENGTDTGFGGEAGAGRGRPAEDDGDGSTRGRGERGDGR
jgi:hypothetical protein